MEEDGYGTPDVLPRHGDEGGRKPCQSEAIHQQQYGGYSLEMAMKASMVSNSGIGKRLLNAEEAAEFLALKVDTVYKKARLRELPSVKVGRALRFDVKALERFVEQHTIKTIE